METGTTMKSDRPTLLAGALRDRASFTELLLVAVLLALAINLLAGALPNSLGWRASRVALLSGLLGLLAVASLVRRIYKQSEYRRLLEGFFVYHTPTNRIVEVSRYEFSEQLSSYLEGAFAENPALKALWDDQPLRRPQKQGDDAPEVSTSRSHAAALLREAVEYFLIDHSSMHITSYFQKRDLEAKRLQRFHRRDVPDVLLSNRFMELFTRPIEERIPFRRSSGGGPERGIVIAAWGEGGAIYQRFELVLPRGSAVTRLSDNTIEIATRRLTLQLRAAFEGYVTNLPRDFERRYMGIEDAAKAEAFGVSISVSVTFRPTALFSRSGWDYYHWVDSFLASLEHGFSEAAFFDRINWELALTVSELMKHESRKTPGDAPRGPTTP